MTEVEPLFLLQDRDGDYVSEIKSGGSETIRYTFHFTPARQQAKRFTMGELCNKHDNLGLAVAFVSGYAGGKVIGDVPTEETERCRSCSAAIVWRKTQTGKSIPLDALPVADGNLAITPEGVATYLSKDKALALQAAGAPVYKSHFATCPQAGKWRKS